ncbi:MAG: hypothetical protein L6420_01705 [Elusimicrobia bacterium]|nr:hypothetical protein [Elusimicrobiota bacterium]
MEKNKKNLLFTSSINSDMEKLANTRKNPFLKNGKYNPDAWLKFASQMNEFMGHIRKPFKPIKGEHFKL